MKVGSILVGGEGKRDSMFLNHLVQIYGLKSRINRIYVHKRNGGGPRNVVSELKKQVSLGNYDKCLLLLDSDLPTDGIDSKWIKELKLTVVKSYPQCLEGLLLNILEDLPKGASLVTSARLKSKFQETYLGTDKSSEANRRLQGGKLLLLFPKVLIEERRKFIAELNAILVF